MFLKRQPPDTAAVIVAAGNAARMEGIDKQHLEIGGLPVLVRSMLAFQRCARVAELVVVCREADISTVLEYGRLYGVEKLKTVTRGGSTRQASVFAGVGCVSPQLPLLAIHDGARPFLSQEMLARCLADGARLGACTAGVPVKDTIKVASAEGRILTTPDRSTLWATQTPQVFAQPLYRQAMARAVAQGESYTDDCQLVEAIGHPVYFSMGEQQNIKITYPQDVCMAEAIAEQFDRGEGGLL